MDALALAHDIEELPPDKQKEIADFVAFLHEQSRAEDKDSVSNPVVRSPRDSMSHLKMKACLGCGLIART